MKKYSFKILALVSLFLICSCESENKGNEKNPEMDSRTEYLPFYNEAKFTPIWVEPNSQEAKELHKIPSFSFVNQNGRSVTDKDFDGKIYVTDFFFTSCPGICPRMTKNMILVQEAFKDDSEVAIISHSVTPEKDSVSVLKDYAEANGVISGKWHLVTGSQEEIYTLGRKSYFVEEDLGLEKDPDEFLHTENFVLIDKNKNIRGIYNGLNKASVAQLIADIKTLKGES